MVKVNSAENKVDDGDHVDETRVSFKIFVYMHIYIYYANIFTCLLKLCGIKSVSSYYYGHNHHGHDH